jgi:hypothetical protein
MPLRYLTLPEPQYIPSYNQVDSRLVSEVDQNIQHQGEQIRQYERDTYGAFTDSAMSQLQGLPEEFQGEVMQMLEQSRGNITSAYEKYGARNAMPAITREAQNVAQQFAPYQQALSQAQQYRERISEVGAEKGVDPNVRRFFESQGQFGRDDQDRINFSSPQTQVLDNWKDMSNEIRDFAKDIRTRKETTGLGQATMTDHLGNEIPVDGYLERISYEILGRDEISALTVNYLIQDPQLREQLEVSLVARGLDPSQDALDNEGKPLMVPKRNPETGIIETDESGEAVYEPAGISNLEAEAMRRVDPTASALSVQNINRKDTRVDKAYEARMDATLPEYSYDIIVPVSAKKFKDINEMSSEYYSFEGEIAKYNEQIQQAIENTDGANKRGVVENLEAKRDQVISEQQDLLDFQQRILNLAEIDLSEENIQSLQEEYQRIYELNLDAKTKRSKGLLMGMAPGFQASSGSLDFTVVQQSLEQFFESGIIDDNVLTKLSNIVGKDKVNKYRDLFKENMKPRSEEAKFVSINDKRVVDNLHRASPIYLGDNAIADMKILHSDESKVQSIHESDLAGTITDLKPIGLTIVDGQLNVIYNALNEDNAPVAKTFAKAPDNFMASISRRSQEELEAYIGSTLNAIVGSTSRQGTVNMGDRSNPLELTIKAQLSDNEARRLNAGRDTFNFPFLLSYRDPETGRSVETVARSREEVINKMKIIQRNLGVL